MIILRVNITYFKPTLLQTKQYYLYSENTWELSTYLKSFYCKSNMYLVEVSSL